MPELGERGAVFGTPQALVARYNFRRPLLPPTRNLQAGQFMFHPASGSGDEGTIAGLPAVGGGLFPWASATDDAGNDVLGGVKALTSPFFVILSSPDGASTVTLQLSGGPWVDPPTAVGQMTWWSNGVVAAKTERLAAGQSRDVQLESARWKVRLYQGDPTGGAGRPVWLAAVDGAAVSRDAGAEVETTATVLLRYDQTIDAGNLLQWRGRRWQIAGIEYPDRRDSMLLSLVEEA